jgi:hypothetical protein
MSVRAVIDVPSLDLMDWELQPCRHGGLCNLINDVQHLGAYSHPPLCPLGDMCTVGGQSDKASRIHAHSFLHKQPCVRGGNCMNPTEAPHSLLFSHPPPCARAGPTRVLTHPSSERGRAGECDNETPVHMAAFLHPPLCPEGRKCPLLSDTEHLKAARHLRNKCTFGTYCRMFADVEHTEQEAHPFMRVCPK